VVAPVSIIIPTLNEEKYLPALLQSINSQTLKPFEVIVSDSISKDGTQEVAKTLGCKVTQVIPPISPAKGRNTGEKMATQETLLFLDSDAKLFPNFLEIAMKEMEEKKFDVATCFVVPSSKSLIYRIGTLALNYYFLLISSLSPHAGGYCILIKKALHDKINGFDESLALGEDHDYVKRASKLGKFGIIKNAKIQISTRRFEEEGLIKIFFKYFFSELQTLIFGKQKTKSSGIRFGNHHKE
jgi:glycosyltransferase involved in cell wall biosynthesis